MTVPLTWFLFGMSRTTERPPSDGVFVGRDDEGRAVRRWYSVLHEFDAAGQLRGSRVKASRTVADGPETAPMVAATQKLLQEWLGSLPRRRFADIAVAPFALEVEGTLFGLVRECHGEYPEGEKRDDWAEFFPSRLGFSAPWDGSYDT